MAKAQKVVSDLLPCEWAALKMADKHYEKVRNQLREGESYDVGVTVRVTGQIIVGFGSKAAKPIDYRLLFAHLVSRMTRKQIDRLQADIEEGIEVSTEWLEKAADVCKALQGTVDRRGSVIGQIKYEVIE